MMEKMNKLRRPVLIMILGTALGVLMILLFTAENPLNVFGALLEGSLVGKLNLGSTLTTYTTLLLTSLGFAIAWNAGFFNAGIEGDLCMGALCCTIVGIVGAGLPKIVLIPLCLIASILGGALWALIPAVANIKWGVNLVCSGNMLNMVALYVSQYFICGPLSEGSSNPQSKAVGARISSIFPPSKLSSGFFIAILAAVLLIWAFQSTTFGVHIKMIGSNKKHARYIGVDPERFGIRMMLMSGMLGGIAGFIEILGNYGYFFNNFFVGLGSKGLLAAMIVKCNPKLIPFSALFVSMLSSGALHMQQTTSVSKAFADTLCAIFIVIASMEELFMKDRKKRLFFKRGGKQNEPA